MKLVLILSLFFVSLLGFSQSINIDDGNWYLFDLNIDSESNLQLISDYRPTPAIFSTNQDTRHLSLGICDHASGNVIIDTSNLTITFSEFTQTLGGCTEESGPNWRLIPMYNSFFNFFQPGTLFRYQLIDENLDQPKKLIITNSNGDYATYFFNTLSISNASKLSDFFMYPNPVKNVLNFKSNINKNSIKLRVLDVNGKILLNHDNFVGNSIHVDNLEKGLYFLSIEDENGQTILKKFIK